MLISRPRQRRQDTASWHSDMMTSRPSLMNCGAPEAARTDLRSRIGSRLEKNCDPALFVDLYSQTNETALRGNGDAVFVYANARLAATTSPYNPSQVRVRSDRRDRSSLLDFTR
jgi:hypothetical protein